MLFFKVLFLKQGRLFFLQQQKILKIKKATNKKQIIKKQIIKTKLKKQNLFLLFLIKKNFCIKNKKNLFIKF